MSFTRRSSANLNQVRATMQVAADSITRRVGEVEHASVDMFTPVEMGLLHERLSQDRITSTEASIGPLEGLRLNDPAPRGTIAAFLRWYSQFKGAKRKYTRRSTPFKAEYAWVDLPQELKALLYLQRRAGNQEMGGPYPPPVYFGAVEKGIVPGISNANREFAEKLRRQIAERIPLVIEQYRRG